jgi:two-component system CheB/CheR fusion protein
MTEHSKDTADLQFPVVGIGASAGGLEAIKQFLKGVPARTGMAYVFVQHLDPTHDSALTEILSKNSSLPIVEIINDVELKPDHFYVVPSNKILTVVDGKLKLDSRNVENKKIKLIDLFFSSLGAVHQSFAVGVILSGTLDDGTLGLKAIKTYGGITFAQDDSAAYDSMPQHAILSGVADFVLAPEKIVSKLIEINKPFQEDLIKNDKTRPKPPEDEDIFRQIVSLLRLRKRVDFAHYKQTTVIRRIQRRMALNQCVQPQDYLKMLTESKTEQDALFNDMLISVTEFFRDSNTFEVVCNTIIPDLLNSKPDNEPLRIWVAGCATGEEAYSMAICLDEFLRKEKSDKFREGRRMQIFATDLSEAAIAKARSGIYSEVDLKMVSPERLGRYFSKIDGIYQVNKNIRECCVFAQHNLIKDPPLSKMDLVSCRNVLIYLAPLLQKRVLTILHYALNEKGVLVLGKSETIGSHAELFTSFNKKEKIYIKKGTTGRFMNVTSAIKEHNMRHDEADVPTQQPAVINAFKKAEEILLTNYTPPGVLVNDNLDIVQFRGQTDPWLTPPPGKPSFNLLKMAREGLSFELRNILHTAKTNNTAAKKENLSFGTNGEQQYVTVEAVPLIDAPEPHYLVLFKKVVPTQLEDPKSLMEIGGSDKKNPLALRIQQLEKELAQNREDMRAITEDQEATNEELQSANEELLSGSEELQAINEELETAKEELQSTNEELSTLNHELLDRFEQLSKSQKFTEGIFTTIRDPLLVLDHEFRIIKATSGFYKKFELTSRETVGKILFELLDNHWNIPTLKKYLENITEENNSFFDIEITQTFPSIGKRNLIINGRQLDRVDGNKMFLLAIEDVTDRKKVEENILTLKKANEGLEHSNLELEQFAGIASHDLQEPLRKIITFSNIIHDRNLNVSEPAKPYLAKIAASAYRMHNLIKDLLNYSRITPDAEQPFTPTDLNEVIKNIMNDFELAIKEKNAELIIKELPVVPAVPLYMNQLFYNLINNALKFSRRGISPKIEISSKILNGPELAHYPNLNNKIPYTEIIVKDNGIGFSQKYAEQVFKLFNRLNNRDEYPGTGIGLALCRKIVVQHGGKIFAKSKEDEGTSFFILLPLTRAT